MDIQEIKETLDSFKIISGCFAIIVGLLVYIWKTDKVRNEKMFDKINETLEELRNLTTIHDVEIKNINK